MSSSNSYHAMQARQIDARPNFRRRLELRKQGGGHPMILVTTLAVGALAGMMFAPVSGVAFASFDPPAKVIEEAHTTPKTARLPRASVLARARTGQAESVKAPGACMPASAVPARRGPIAYV